MEEVEIGVFHISCHKYNTYSFLVEIIKNKPEDDTNLSAHPVWRRPQGIVLLRDFTVINDPLQLLHHALVNVRLQRQYMVKILLKQKRR